MCFYKKQYSLLFRGITIILACLFITNDIAWAQPADYSASKSTLAAPTALSDPEFKKEFALGAFQLSGDGVRHYINKQIKLENSDAIFGDKWKERRAEIVDDISDPLVRGRIKGTLDGLRSIAIVRVSGLLASSGQAAFADLTGEIEASKEFGGIPVVYIDSTLTNTPDKCVQKHEIDEILQWEYFRTKVLHINTREGMGAWIRKHIRLPDNRLKGTDYEELNTCQIAELFHGYSYPLRELYKKLNGTTDLDYAYIRDMLQRYPAAKSERINIAAQGEAPPDHEEAAEYQLIDGDTNQAVHAWRGKLTTAEYSKIVKQHPNLILKNIRLDKRGRIELPRENKSIARRVLWLSKYPGRLIEAGIEQGFVTKVRIYKEDPSGGVEAEEVLPQFIDGITGEIVDTFHRMTPDKLKRALKKHSKLILKNYNLTNYGVLHLSGQKSDTSFRDFPGRLIEADIEKGATGKGFVTRVKIFKEKPEEGIEKEAIYSQFVAKSTGKIVYTSWGQIYKPVFKQLVKKYHNLILKNGTLNKYGAFYLASKTAVANFSGFSNRFIEADIEQGIKEEGFVARVRIFKENPGDGVEGEKIFSQLIDKVTGKIVHTWSGALSSTNYRKLVKRFPCLILKNHRLSEWGGLHFGGKLVWHTFLRAADCEVEAEIQDGDIAMVRIIWGKEGKKNKSRVIPGYGKIKRQLFTGEDKFKDVLAKRLTGQEIAKAKSELVADTLVRLSGGSLDILVQYGLITETMKNAIEELDISRIDIKDLTTRLIRNINKWQELGFTDADIEKMLATHLLPAEYIEYLQRTYRLGRSTRSIIGSLRSCNPKSYIAYMKDAYSRRGTLNRKRHLKIYDPNKLFLLNKDQRKSLLEKLKTYLGVLEILSVNEMQRVECEKIMQVDNGYRLTLKTRFRDIKQGDILYMEDYTFILQVKSIKGKDLTVMEKSGSEITLPKGDVVMYTDVASAITYNIQRQILSAIISNLAKSGLKTTGFGVMDRVFMLTKDTSAPKSRSEKAKNLFDEKIKRRIIYTADGGRDFIGDESQEEAVELSLSGSKIDVLYGPAGTGKTKVIAEIIRHLVNQGKKVLLVSQMNQAVDNALKEVMGNIPALRIGNNKEPLARYGTDKIWIHDDQALKGFTAKLKEKNGGFLFAATDIGIATDRKARRLLREKDFDVVIMDEASRETLTGALVPLQYLKDAGKLILVGDTKQLKPFKTMEQQRILKEKNVTSEDIESFFESILSRVEKKNMSSEVMLSTNWRSHPLISGLVSYVFYGGAIHARGWEDFTPDTLSLKIIDISAKENKYFEEPVGTSYQNTKSAMEVMKLLRDYVVEKGIPPDKITVITSLKPQEELLTNLVEAEYLLKQPKITTIDSYQGGENDTIIIDFVRSNPQGNIGFIKDINRLNVALSRAKENMSIVWDSRVFMRTPEKILPQDKEARKIFRKILNYYMKEVWQFFPEELPLIGDETIFGRQDDGGASERSIPGPGLEISSSDVNLAPDSIKQAPASEQPDAEGPALFLDPGTHEIRELTKYEHSALHEALRSLIDFTMSESGIFDKNGVRKITENEAKRLIGQELISSITDRGPPLDIYIIDDASLANALPEKHKHLVPYLITHAGTWRNDPSGQKHANLFIPRSIYNILFSLKSDSAELLFWRRHEIKHLVDREGSIGSGLAHGDKELTHNILAARNAFRDNQKTNLQQTDPAVPYFVTSQPVQFYYFLRFGLRKKMHTLIVLDNRDRVTITDGKEVKERVINNDNWIYWALREGLAEKVYLSSSRRAEQRILRLNEYGIIEERFGRLPKPEEMSKFLLLIDKSYFAGMDEPGRFTRMNNIIKKFSKYGSRLELINLCGMAFSQENLINAKTELLCRTVDLNIKSWSMYAKALSQKFNPRDMEDFLEQAGDGSKITSALRWFLAESVKIQTQLGQDLLFYCESTMGVSNNDAGSLAGNGTSPLCNWRSGEVWKQPFNILHAADKMNSSKWDRALTICRWVQENILSCSGATIVSAHNTISKKAGTPFSRTNAQIALLRAEGIRCRFVLDNIKNGLTSHIFAELFIGNKWLRYDLKHDKYFITPLYLPGRCRYFDTIDGWVEKHMKYGSRITQWRHIGRENNGNFIKSREGWINYIKTFVPKVPTDKNPTIKNVVSVSGGKLTAHGIRNVFTYFKISYEDVGMVKDVRGRKKKSIQAIPAAQAAGAGDMPRPFVGSESETDSAIADIAMGYNWGDLTIAEAVRKLMEEVLPAFAYSGESMLNFDQAIFVLKKGLEAGEEVDVDKIKGYSPIFFIRQAVEILGKYKSAPDQTEMKKELKKSACEMFFSMIFFANYNWFMKIDEAAKDLRVKRDSGGDLSEPLQNLGKLIRGPNGSTKEITDLNVVTGKFKHPANPGLARVVSHPLHSVNQKVAVGMNMALGDFEKEVAKGQIAEKQIKNFETALLKVKKIIATAGYLVLEHLADSEGGDDYALFFNNANEKAADQGYTLDRVAQELTALLKQFPAAPDSSFVSFFGDSASQALMFLTGPEDTKDITSFKSNPIKENQEGVGQKYKRYTKINQLTLKGRKEDIIFYTKYNEPDNDENYRNLKDMALFQQDAADVGLAPDCLIIDNGGHHILIIKKVEGMRLADYDDKNITRDIMEAIIMALGKLHRTGTHGDLTDSFNHIYVAKEQSGVKVQFIDFNRSKRSPSERMRLEELTNLLLHFYLIDKLCLNGGIEEADFQTMMLKIYNEAYNSGTNLESGSGDAKVYAIEPSLLEIPAAQAAGAGDMPRPFVGSESEDEIASLLEETVSILEKRQSNKFMQQHKPDLAAWLFSKISEYDKNVQICFLKILKSYLNNEIPANSLAADLSPDLLHQLGLMTERWHLWTDKAIDDFAGKLKPAIQKIRNRTGKDPVIIELSAGYGDLSFGLQKKFPDLRVIPTDEFLDYDNNPPKDRPGFYEPWIINQRNVQKLLINDIVTGEFRHKLNIPADVEAIAVAAYLLNDKGIERALLNQDRINELFIMNAAQPGSASQKVTGDSMPDRIEGWQLLRKQLAKNIYFDAFTLPIFGGPGAIRSDTSIDIWSRTNTAAKAADMCKRLSPQEAINSLKKIRKAEGFGYPDGVNKMPEERAGIAEALFELTKPGDRMVVAGAGSDVETTWLGLLFGLDTYYTDIEEKKVIEYKKSTGEYSDILKLSGSDVIKGCRADIRTLKTDIELDKVKVLIMTNVEYVFNGIDGKPLEGSDEFCKKEIIPLLEEGSIAILTPDEASAIKRNLPVTLQMKELQYKSFHTFVGNKAKVYAIETVLPVQDAGADVTESPIAQGAADQPQALKHKLNPNKNIIAAWRQDSEGNIFIKAENLSAEQKTQWTNLDIDALLKDTCQYYDVIDTTAGNCLKTRTVTELRVYGLPVGLKSKEKQLLQFKLRLADSVSTLPDNVKIRSFDVKKPAAQAAGVLKAIIFDLDGVIVTLGAHFKAWEDILSKRNMGLSWKEFIKRFNGTSSTDMAGALFPDADKAQIAEIAQEKDSAYNAIIEKDGIEKYESTIIKIRELRKQGIKLAVASNGFVVNDTLKSLGIRDLFDEVITLKDVTHEKPNPEMFLLAAKKMGASPSETAVVGDSKLDMKAAKDGGFGAAIALNRGGVDSDDIANDLRQAGATEVFKDMSEVSIGKMEEMVRSSPQNSAAQDAEKVEENPTISSAEELAKKIAKDRQQIDPIYADMVTFAKHIDRMRIKPGQKVIVIGPANEWIAVTILALYGCEVDIVEPDEVQLEKLLKNVRERTEEFYKDENRTKEVMRKIHPAPLYLRNFLQQNTGKKYNGVVAFNVLDLSIMGKKTSDDLALLWQSLEDKAVLIISFPGTNVISQLKKSVEDTGLNIKVEKTKEEYKILGGVYNYSIRIWKSVNDKHKKAAPSAGSGVGETSKESVFAQSSNNSAGKEIAVKNRDGIHLKPALRIFNIFNYLRDFDIEGEITRPPRKNISQEEAAFLGIPYTIKEITLNPCKNYSALVGVCDGEIIKVKLTGPHSVTVINNLLEKLEKFFQDEDALKYGLLEKHYGAIKEALSHKTVAQDEEQQASDADSEGAMKAQNAPDIEALVSILNKIIPERDKQRAELDYYTIRYNATKIPQGSSAETLLKIYANQVLPAYLHDEKRVDLVPSASQTQGLISVECYKDQGRSQKIGEGRVDIKEDISGKALRIIGMLNMAFLASLIPNNISGDEMNSYEALKFLIKRQFKDISGEDLPDGVFQDIRNGIFIELPRAAQVPVEKAEEYYRLTIKQLRQNA